MEMHSLVLMLCASCRQAGRFGEGAHS